MGLGRYNRIASSLCYRLIASHKHCLPFIAGINAPKADP